MLAACVCFSGCLLLQMTVREGVEEDIGIYKSVLARGRRALDLIIIGEAL
jgi:hypothetical protein